MLLGKGDTIASFQRLEALGPDAVDVCQACELWGGGGCENTVGGGARLTL